MALVLGALLGAGGLTVTTFVRSGDSGADQPSTTTSAVSTTDAPTTSVPPSPTTAPPTTTPSTTAEPTPTTTAVPPLRTIEVTVGSDDGPERVDTVALGSPVELKLTNPDADDEFHLHGYDLGGNVTVPAGETLTLSFVADRAGLFELESHVTHDVILFLLVE